jgi:hypothetical protein
MMRGNLGLSESAIPQYLDHQATKGNDVQPLPAISPARFTMFCRPPCQAKAQGAGRLGRRVATHHLGEGGGWTACCGLIF